MTEPTRLPRLMKEAVAAAQLGVSVDTLRRERKAAHIAYTMIRGRVRYTEEHLVRYVHMQERGPCASEMTDTVKSEGTGSAVVPIPRRGVEPGSTNLPDRRAAFLSAQMILSRPS
jgi:hypothetical protein